MNSLIKSLFRSFRVFCIHALSSFARPISIDDCVILAPHPDDETLGCGSLIAATINAGKRVEIVVLSDGAASHNGCCDITPEALNAAREADAVAALKILGVTREHIHFLHLQDGKLTDEIPTHKNEILELLNSLGIKTVLVPHPLEGWDDHEAVSRLGDDLEQSGWTRFYYLVWFYFSMPFRKFGKVAWKTAKCIENTECHKMKQHAAKIYLTDCAPCGKPFAGVLPEELQNAVLTKRELYFNI